MMKAVPLLLVIIAAVWLPPGASAQTCGFDWVNPLPPRAQYYRVYGRSGLFVAVGSQGTVATSTDGSRWMFRDSGTTNTLYGIVWGEGSFSAVGDGVVVASGDGAQWTVRWSDTTVRLNDVAYGAGRFVAVGSGLGSSVLVSESGSSWQPHDTGWTGIEDSIEWNGSEFLASGDGRAWGSSDGLVWEPRGSVPGRATKLRSDLSEFDRSDLGFDGTVWVWAGGMEVYTSVDGWDWYLQKVLNSCADWSGFLGVTADDGLIVVSGVNACPDPFINSNSLIIKSKDGGSTWSEVLNERGGGVSSIARLGSLFIAVGGAGEILHGVAGGDWTCLPGTCNADACDDRFFDITASPTSFLAAGGVGPCETTAKRIEGATVASSPTGDLWDVQEIDIGRLHAVQSNGLLYVGGGENFAASSTNGVDWTAVDLGAMATLRSVEWGAGTFVAVGSGGAVYSTTDGAYWGRQYSFTEADLEDVVWTGELFVAVGAGGTLITSIDGYNWSLPICVCSADLLGITHVGSRVFVSADQGRMWFSDDLVQWNPVVTGTKDTLTDLSWDGEHLVAVGYGPESGDGSPPATIMASSDGAHWTRLYAPGRQLGRVLASGGAHLAVGADRTLLKADCLGVLMALDPIQNDVPWGESAQLVLTLSESMASETTIGVTSSLPTAVQVPSTVSIPAGGDQVEITVTGVQVVEDVWITAIMPPGLGASSVSAQVAVVAPLPAPRRGGGRIAP